MKKATLNPILFPQLIQPYGFLPNRPEAHALWFYFCCATSNYKNEMENIRYEGDQTRFNYFGLWTTVAQLYAVNPSLMQNLWPAVDMQARSMGLTLLPKESKYRSPGHQHAAVRPKSS